MGYLSFFRQNYKSIKIFVGKDVLNLFILAIVLGILWFFVESSFIFIIQSFLLSIGLIEPNHSILPKWFPTEIWITTLILIGFGVIRGTIVAMKYYLSIATTEFFVSHQKSQILEVSLQNAPNMSTHEIMMSFSEYTHTSASALQQIAMLINNFVSITLFVLAGFYLTPKEFILSVLLLSLVVIPIYFFNRQLSGFGKIINAEKEAATKVIVNGLKNNFFLQIYHLIAAETAKGKNALHNYQLAYHRYGRLGGIRNAFPQIAGSIVIASVAFVSIKFFHTSGGKLLSFFYILVRLSQCVSDFYATAGDIKVQLIGLKTLYSWNQKLEEFKNQEKVREISLEKNALNNISIKIENLSFSYDKQKILSDLNISLKPSEILLIRGESGAGKSTLLSLILGLNMPQSGSVLINDYPPCLIRTNLAEKIGYVGPEPFLIGGTVKENLLYGHPYPEKVSDEQLWNSLAKAQLKNDIDSLPKKLNENLLERTQFSTGQKQRLSIARALARTPSLLILDEATANLDPDTEAKIIELLSNIAKEMTTLIVTHKDSFNSISTKIIKLEKILDRGIV
jgi:ABC-type multidrug transport system fused ATPase/permease subunit